MAGALLFGIVGLIIAVPVALAIKVTLAALYDEETPPAQPHKAEF